MATELRQAVSRELQDNADKYVKHPHFLHVCNELNLDHQEMLLIFHAMIDDQNTQNLSSHNLEEVIRREGQLTANQDYWASLLHTVATSTLLKCNIESIYPDVPWNYRSLYHCTIEPLEHDTTLIFPPQVGKYPVKILWTRDGTFDNMPGVIFKANHVVPVVPAHALLQKKRSADPSPTSSKRQSTILDFLHSGSASQTQESNRPVEEQCNIPVQQPTDTQSSLSDDMDIAHFVNKVLSDDTKMKVINHVQQPKSTHRFRQSSFGKQKRSFQHQWLSKYKYLVYSKVQDGAYCLPCVLFAVGSDKGSLCQTPFKDWKDAVERFEGISWQNTS